MHVQHLLKMVNKPCRITMSGDALQTFLQVGNKRSRFIASRGPEGIDQPN